MAHFFSTVPISEPIRGDFIAHDDFGGIGWDQKQGMFIIVDEELDQFVPPAPRDSEMQ